MEDRKALTWEEMVAAEDEIEGGFRVGREDEEAFENPNRQESPSKEDKISEDKIRVEKIREGLIKELKEDGYSEKEIEEFFKYFF